MQPIETLMKKKKLLKKIFELIAKVQAVDEVATSRAKESKPKKRRSKSRLFDQFTSEICLAPIRAKLLSVGYKGPVISASIEERDDKGFSYEGCDMKPGDIYYRHYFDTIVEKVYLGYDPKKGKYLFAYVDTGRKKSEMLEKVPSLDILR